MMALLKRIFLHNFGLKLLSLFLAAGLWLMIARDEQPAEVALRAPIVFQNVPSHLEISSESIPEAQIRIRGPERIIRQLQPNEIHAEIDLGDAKPGERTYDLNTQEVRHPREVRVVQIVPSQLHLSFDNRLTREVQIHPSVSVDIAAGEQIVKCVLDPPSIRITGPQQHVEKVEAASTDTVDAKGVNGTAVFTTNAFVADPLVQVVDSASIRVTVTVQKSRPGIAH